MDNTQRERNDSDSRRTYGKMGLSFLAGLLSGRTLFRNRTDNDNGRKRHPIRTIFIIIIVFLLLRSGCNKLKNNPTDSFTKIKWPDNEIASLLPIPESNIGEISSETADGFSVEIGKISKEQFYEYVEKCKEKGFVVDYYRASTYYSAQDEFGNDLRISYDEDNNCMWIHASEKDD